MVLWLVLKINYMKKNLIIIQNLEYFQKIFPIERIQVYNSEITLVISKDLLKDVLFFLKNNILCQFKVLTSIAGVDYPLNKFRFQVVYDLLSLKFNSRFRIKIFSHELMPVFSCVHIFFAANWFESEIWDMFGVFFKNHTNLKRILTDYGFEGHPLRKDYPLEGFLETRYSFVVEGVMQELLSFSSGLKKNPF